MRNMTNEDLDVLMEVMKLPKGLAAVTNRINEVIDSKANKVKELELKK